MRLVKDALPISPSNLGTWIPPLAWLPLLPVFAQHKEKCHLYSLWIIIHMDTKLPTTQYKHTMFLSLLQANVPSESARNIILATCKQNKYCIITRRRVTLFVEAPPLHVYDVFIKCAKIFVASTVLIKHVWYNFDVQPNTHSCMKTMRTVCKSARKNSAMSLRCTYAQRHERKSSWRP